MAPDVVHGDAGEHPAGDADDGGGRGVDCFYPADAGDVEGGGEARGEALGANCAGAALGSRRFHAVPEGVREADVELLGLVLVSWLAMMLGEKGREVRLWACPR